MGITRFYATYCEEFAFCTLPWLVLDRTTKTPTEDGFEETIIEMCATRQEARVLATQLNSGQRTHSDFAARPRMNW